MITVSGNSGRKSNVQSITDNYFGYIGVSRVSLFNSKPRLNGDPHSSPLINNYKQL